MSLDYNNVIFHHALFDGLVSYGDKPGKILDNFVSLLALPRVADYFTKKGLGINVVRNELTTKITVKGSPIHYISSNSDKFETFDITQFERTVIISGSNTHSVGLYVEKNTNKYNVILINPGEGSSAHEGNVDDNKCNGILIYEGFAESQIKRFAALLKQYAELDTLHDSIVHFYALIVKFLEAEKQTQEGTQYYDQNYFANYYQMECSEIDLLKINHETIYRIT